jgi:hypothetical protein
MPNATRRGFGGRADVIEVFSPRRSGPWHLLRPLHTKVGFVILAALTLIGFIHFDMVGQPGLAGAVLIAAAALFVLSFAVVWQLAGLLIRSRAELTGVTLTVFTASLVGAFLPVVWAYTVVLSLLTALFALPWSRRFVVGRMWCVIDRHRLRLCLRQTKVRTMNMDGSLPLMLWARPTKTGERIWMWIRAGSAAEDIESALGYIAPACYAREARLHQVRKVTTLVAIEVIRRDPLSKPEPILSVLKKYIPVLDKNRSTEGTEAIKAATVIDITSTPVEPVVVANERKSRKTTAVPVTAVPSVMVGGEDLSDYID